MDRLETQTWGEALGGMGSHFQAYVMASGPSLVSEAWSDHDEHEPASPKPGSLAAMSGTMHSLQLAQSDPHWKEAFVVPPSGGRARWLSIAKGLLILACASPVSQARAEDFSGVVRASFEIFEPSTPVSDAFRSQTAEVAQAVPPHVWSRLRGAGWRVRLAEFTVDGYPSLQYDRPRGWPADMDWNNIDAALIPTERLLILAEKRRNRRGQVVASARVAGVFRHELGHAFDVVSGEAGHYRSRSVDFQTAYVGDCRAMSAERHLELGYYLQPDDAGRQETYAEAFGIVLGGGSDSPRRAAFESSFSRVLAVVRSDLGM